jgi:hypothetical protein
MNSILTIQPYRHAGTWVFDDPTVGLVKEPFVAGVPEIIDEMVARIPGAERGFRMLFSAGPFPGAQATMEWVREEADGNWYRWTERGTEGWLCPALFKYFEQAPPRLYVRAEPLPAAARRAEVITVPRERVEALLRLLEEGEVDEARAMVEAALG